MDISQAVELALSNCLKEGLNDIFPKCFEVDMLKNEGIYKEIKKRTISVLNKQNFDEMNFLPLQHSYIPKKEAFDFRKAALIQPWDLIKYLSLVLLCAEDIERKRPALEKEIVFSYRFRPNDGYLFHLNYDYNAFKKSVKEKIIRKNYNLYIKADIANFFDRLNLHRLENILLSYCSNGKVIKTINKLLFFWSNKDSYGIPVGSNASRILAEAALIEVDNYLISQKIDFCRFVDDYRIFANNAKEAHLFLNKFIARLALEGLYVNTGKTVIEPAKNYTEKEKEEILEHNKKNMVVSKEKEEKKAKWRIIVGYSGIIPLKFRNPTLKEIEKLRKMNVAELKSSISEQEILNPDIIRNFAKYIVATNVFQDSIILLNVIDKFPQFIPYITDFYLKKHKNIPANLKLIIQEKYKELLSNTQELPEYILQAAARLLSETPFEDKFVLLNCYRTLRRSAGVYISRYLLELLESKLTRGEVLEIKSMFNSVGLWEKRMITKIIKTILPEDEQKPWIRNNKFFMKECPFLEVLSRADYKP